MDLQALFNPRLPRWRVALVVVPAVVGWLLLSSSYVVRTVGVALLLMALYAGLRELLFSINRLEQSSWVVRGRSLRRLREALPVLLITGAVGVLLWPLVSGEMPQTHDHTFHFTRAWHFFEHRLSQGHFTGWSDIWFAGWPAGEDYSPGADFLVTAIYIFTLGLLGWEATYAVSIVVVFLLICLAVYRFGRVYFGVTAGLVGALFVLADHGRWSSWNYTVFWGVWPFVLSGAFFLLSLVTLDRIFGRCRAVDVAACALWVGASFISHPVALIYYGMASPLLLVIRLPGAPHRLRSLIGASISLAVGFLLSAFWIVPFIVKSDWMAKFPTTQLKMEALAGQIWQGSLYLISSMPVFIWLGVIGGALVLYRRHRMGMFLLAFTALNIYLFSDECYKVLLKLSPSFGYILYHRMMVLAKIGLFLLSGHVIGELFGRLGGTPKEQPTGSAGVFGWQRYLVTCFVILALSPWAIPVRQSWIKKYGDGAVHKKIQTRSRIRNWKDYEAYFAWYRKLDPKKHAFFRIAYHLQAQTFATAPFHNFIPVYKIGFSCCTNFRYRPDKPVLYKWLSIKYVVSNRLLHDQSSYKLEKQFGRIRVYRYLHYSPQRYTLEGPGKVEVRQFADERMQLRLSAVKAPGSKLILHRANYYNWKATLDGRPVAIETAALGGQKLFISVPAKDGTYEFIYTWPTVNLVSSIISLLSLAALLLVVAHHLRGLYLRRRRDGDR